MLVWNYPFSTHFRTGSALHVGHSDGIPEKFFFEKVDCEQNQQTTKKHEKFLRGQRVNIQRPNGTSSSIYSSIRCPLDITADDFFCWRHPMVWFTIIYSATDNGLFLSLMPSKFYHFVCFRLFTYLYVLFMYL